MRALIAVLAAGVLAACSRVIPAKPPMWRVTGGRATAWLLGSMHVLPDHVDWQDGVVARAIADADTLVLESNPEATSDFNAIAKTTGMQPLARRLSSDQREALRRAIARAGLSENALDGYKDWSAAVMLGAGDAAHAGASPQRGVDAQLWQRFARHRRATLALERVGAQLRVLDALPPALQHLMLEEAVSGAPYDSVLRAWSNGDVAALDRSTGAQNLRAFLVVSPNRRWSAWIARRMAHPGTLLIALGAGHFVGTESIVAMLASRGFNVARVQ